MSKNMTLGVLKMPSNKFQTYYPKLVGEFDADESHKISIR